MSGTAGFDVERLRRDFPILTQQMHGRQLVYLDNAATSQKPQAVIDALARYYSEFNANVHRGVHQLSVRATREYEAARDTVARFINAGEAGSVVFVRGATEAINLVAQSYARPRLKPGDEILVTEMEHHSNIVPWQLVCEQTGASLRVAPINEAGELDYEQYLKRLNANTRLVAVTHLSNALGTIVPLHEVIEAAHAAGARVLVDGAQAAPHLPIDVRALDCDFYTLSGHKVYGPTGIGALYGKPDLLEAMPPYQGGGEMILQVRFEGSSYAQPPARFEAGTPNIAGALGMAAAIDYIDALGLEAIGAYEHALLDYATQRIAAVPNVRLVGTAQEKSGIVSFVMDNAHAHDIGTILDDRGIAIRTGHHCAMPVMERFGVAATARASFALYNTRADADALAEGLDKVNEVFRK